MAYLDEIGLGINSAWRGNTRMKEILLINMHWNNRGDEAANRSLIDKIRKEYPKTNITVQLISDRQYGIEKINKEGVIVLSTLFPKRRHILEWWVSYLTKGKIVISKAGRDYIVALKKADLVIYCPGGPAIGDIYYQVENSYIRRMLLAIRLKKPLFIYSPSAGPFNIKNRNRNRKKIFGGAAEIVFREGISGKYLEEIIPEAKYSISVDTAFLGENDEKSNEILLKQDRELVSFLSKHCRVIGITITDLQWNSLYKDNMQLRNTITKVFEMFVSNLVSKGYGVLFIPQLFGDQNDFDYMCKFVTNDCYILNDKYDCNFQQYLISKMYAVVGMRYHSNIFSCKMGIPFISISYEQKMKGFMETAGLQRWCINVKDIEINNLMNTFEQLENEYLDYKETVEAVSIKMQQKASETFGLLEKYLK